MINLQPTSNNDRIQYLDILRGIAILFIFLANIPFFSGYYFLSEEEMKLFSTHHLDYIWEVFSVIFIDGKFYSIFSILFGIGFYIQYNNHQNRGSDFVPFFRRRMFGLLLFGFIHLFFLWIGDILTLYALLGFVLILFRNTNSKKLLIWAGVLILMPIVHWAIMSLAGFFYPALLAQWASSLWTDAGLLLRDWRGTGTPIVDPLVVITTSSFTEFFEGTFILPIMRLMYLIIEGRPFKVLGLFLIGIWAGRMMINQNLLENTALLKKILLFGLLLGIPMNIFRAYIEFSSFDGPIWDFWAYFSYAFGVIPLACSYTAMLALILQKKSSAFGFFAPVGRMALSSYITQTILAITICYGIGFGLSLDFGLSFYIVIASLIFIAQIFISKWWLQRYRFGPLEWLWRSMTYGKLSKIKKDK